LKTTRSWNSRTICIPWCNSCNLF